MSNSRMQNNDPTDHRLTELEIKASFNEDLLEQLNQVVIRQQQQIDALIREVGQLRQQIPDAGSSGVFNRAGDDLPPHY
ncbi:MAG: SlyX family protein [Polaromonas sp.]|jgi:SlyX protein|nr:SlyX family protein [Polaromonas sp.]